MGLLGDHLGEVAGCGVVKGLECEVDVLLVLGVAFAVSGFPITGFPAGGFHE